ncbi:MAG TPA: hypothetical protein VFP68_24300, partial [Burkholderiaceae bacterium]|nr:hypothetical protein [Burkholderiaceae bacterium]
MEAFAQALREAALAVSSAQGDSVFADLVRTLAAILRVDMAFIALFVDDPTCLEMRAAVMGGQAV